MAVAAEFLHNAVDLISAAAVLVGLKIATRTSKAFPYGLYKVENVVAAAIGGMIFFTAYQIARHVFFGGATQLRIDAWMFAALLAPLAIPLVFSHYELRAG